MPRIGHGVSIGIAVESTWGTPVSRTNWLHVISANGGSAPEYADREHLQSLGQASVMTQNQAYLVRNNVTASLEWEAAYDDSTLFLWQHAMGASSVSTGGSGPYTHTYTLKKANPVGLTLEILEDDKAEVLDGGQCESLTWSVDAGTPLKCSSTWVFQSSGGKVSAGTPTYTSNGNLIMSHHAGNFTWNAGNLGKPTSMTWTLTNSQAKRVLLGSAAIAEPLKEMQEVAGQLTIEVSSTTDALYAAYLANTVADASIAFTDSPRSATFTFHNLQFRSVSSPRASRGILRYTFDFVCRADTAVAGDQGITFAVVNANTAHTAN